MNKLLEEFCSQRHPALMFLATLVMAVLATVALLSQLEETAILYKAF